MTPGEPGRSDSKATDDVLSDIFHELSQPLTTLECGLELALRYDTTVAQLRKRLSVLLETTSVMHQRLVQLRALQQGRGLHSCNDESRMTELAIPNDF